MSADEFETPARSLDVCDVVQALLGSWRPLVARTDDGTLFDVIEVDYDRSLDTHVLVLRPRRSSLGSL